MNYDVFVSYRRNAFESANLIAEKMRSMGYSVFFDVETLRAGNFNEQLFNVIDKCNDFVLVLSPNALDRCKDEEDWVRKEVLRAISSKKNIIPVLLSGFEFPSPMPTGLEKIAMYQAITAGQQEFFDMSMKRLAGYLKSKPHRNMRNYIKKSAIAFFLVLALAGIAIFSVYQYSKPLYRNFSTNITSGMSSFNILYGELSKLSERWEKFIEQYEYARTDEERDKAITDFSLFASQKMEEIEFFKNQFIRLPQPSSHQASLLGIHDIESHEIEAFYSIYDILFYSIQEQLEYALSIVSTPGMCEKSIRAHNTTYITSSVQMTQAMIENIFYSYLELMSKFPKYAHEQYNIQSPTWNYLPKSVGLTLSIEEYRVYQDAAASKAEKIMVKMETDVAKFNGEIDSEKQIISEQVQK